MRTISTLILLQAALTVRATIFNATFTWYGQGDERGSPNCNTNTAACGFYTSVCQFPFCTHLTQPLRVLIVQISAWLLGRCIAESLQPSQWRWTLLWKMPQTQCVQGSEQQQFFKWSWQRCHRYGKQSMPW